MISDSRYSTWQLIAGIALTCAFLLSPPATASENEAFAFKGITLGMSIQEVESLGPFDCTLTGSESRTGTCNSTASLADSSFGTFLGNKVWHLRMYLFDGEVVKIFVGTGTDWLAKARDAIPKKYGEPDSESDRSDSFQGSIKGLWNITPYSPGYRQQQIGYMYWNREDQHMLIGESWLHRTGEWVYFNGRDYFKYYGSDRAFRIDNPGSSSDGVSPKLPSGYGDALIIVSDKFAEALRIFPDELKPATTKLKQETDNKALLDM